MIDEVHFCHADKHRSILQVDAVILGVLSQEYPKYLQKNVEDEVDFLSGEKHERFLQADSITFGACSQACPKYSK